MGTALLLIAMCLWASWAIKTEPRRWRWLWDEVETERFIEAIREPVMVGDVQVVEITDTASDPLEVAEAWRGEMARDELAAYRARHS
jgi:hypothetical protein